MLIFYFAVCKTPLDWTSLKCDVLIEKKMCKPTIQNQRIYFKKSERNDVGCHCNFSGGELQTSAVKKAKDTSTNGDLKQVMIH